MSWLFRTPVSIVSDQERRQQINDIFVAASNKSNVIRMLDNNNIDMNSPECVDMYNNNLLHIAVQTSNKYLVRQLIERDITGHMRNSKNKFKQIPFDIAVEMNNIDLIHLIEEYSQLEHNNTRRLYSELKTTNKELKEQLTQLKNDNQELDEQVSQLENDNQELEEFYENRVTTFENKFENLEGYVAQLENDNEELEAAHENFEEHISQLENDNYELKDKVALLENNNEKLQQCINTHNEHVKTITEQLTEYRTAVESVIKSNNTLCAENVTLRLKVGHLEQQLNHKRQRDSDSSDENNSSDEETEVEEPPTKKMRANNN